MIESKKKFTKPSYTELKDFLERTNFSIHGVVPTSNMIEAFIKKWYTYADFISLRLNDTLIALVVLYANREEKDFSYISYIAVHPSYRGHHLGTFLLKQATIFARSKGFHQLELEVNKTSQIALNMYKRNGFKLKDLTNLSYYMVKPL